jgi:hypothetical protein
MNQVAPESADNLHAELRTLITSRRQRLAQEFGRGFEAKNLRRILQFVVAFPDTEKVASLMRHLSWAGVMTTQSRHFICRNSPCAPL